MPGMNNAIWPRGCSSREKSWGYTQLHFLIRTASFEHCYCTAPSVSLDPAWHTANSQHLGYMDPTASKDDLSHRKEIKHSAAQTHHNTERASLKKGFYQEMLAYSRPTNERNSFSIIFASFGKVKTKNLPPVFRFTRFLS